MYVKDIQEACRKVLNGNEEALQQLGLDDATYPVPKPRNTSTASLQVTYNGVLNTAMAARELQLVFLEKQCELTLEYVQAIAVAKKVTLKHEVDVQDVAKIMLALIDAEAQKYRQDDPPDFSDSEEGTAESREQEQPEREEGKEEKQAQ